MILIRKPYLMIVAFVTIAFSSNLSMAAQAGKIDISKKNCENLMRQHAVAGADYKPGVDVRGNKVAGADLNGGSQIKLPETISIPINLDVASKYGIGSKDGTFSSEALLGTVSVKAGKAYWNGKPLQASDEDTIVNACRDQYGVK